MASKVDPAWLAEVAPHMVSKKVEKLYWSSEQKCVVEDHLVMFNDQEIAREAKPCDWSEEAFKIFVNAMMSTCTSSEVVNALYSANSEVLNQYNTYYVRSGGTINKIDSDIIRELYLKVLMPYQVLSFEAFVSSGVNPDDLMIKIEDLISLAEVAEIEKQNPEVIEVEGKEFSVTYEKNYNGEFIAKIIVTEDFISETTLGQILIPSGRELKLTCNGYTQTLSEHRTRIEKTHLEEIERSQRSLVYDFQNQISSSLSVPSEMPFYNYGTTELGRVLQNCLETLKTEMIEGLTLENSVERIEIVKTTAEEIKTEIRTQYESAQALIINMEESFEKSLAEVEQNFVQEEEGLIPDHFYHAKNALQKAEFVEVKNHCCEAEEMIASLSDLATKRKKVEDELVKSHNVPDYLLRAFRGDLERTLQFMSNVEKIETYRLDSHEITCGRGRARKNIDDAWSAMGMGEKSDFFLCSDPNDVKYYVYNYHFGSEEYLNNQDDESDVEEIPKNIKQEKAKPMTTEDLEKLRDKFMGF
jgi:hypothetical protein